MRDFAERFYDGKAWRGCRAAYIAERRRIDGGLCERCHDKLGLIVHHKVMLTEDNIGDPEIALNHELLEYLCLDCHNMEPGHWAPSGARKCIFDENGDVVAAR